MAMASGDIGASGQMLPELVHDIGRSSGFGDVYKRECTDLSRRIGLLSRLFEDMRDLKGDNNAHPFTSTSSSSSSSLKDLLGVLRSAKRLLLVARNYDSKTSPDLSCKKVTFQFQCITWKLERALGNIPYDQFNISEEAQEQVELVPTQLRRAEKRNGSLNSKIVSRALSEPLDKTNMPDSGNRVIRSLHVESIGNVDHKSRPLVDIVPKVNGKMGHNMEQMIHERARPQRVSSSSEAYILNKADSNKEDDLAGKSSEESKKPDSIVTPDDC